MAGRKQSPVWSWNDVPSAQLRERATSTDENIDAAAERRLLAVADVLEGESKAETARRFAVHPDTIKCWCGLFDQEGIDGLLAPAHLPVPVTRDDFTAVELRELAARESISVRPRLLAIADILDGKKKTATARKFTVMPSTIRRWIGLYNEDSIDGLLDAAYLPVPVTRDDFTAVELRELAARERISVKHRLLAIADILDGKTKGETGKKFGVSSQTISYWLRHFNAGGASGLRLIGAPMAVSGSIASEGLRKKAIGLDQGAAQRLLAVADLVDGCATNAVARKLKIGPDEVARWRRVYNREGLESLIELRLMKVEAVRDELQSSEIREVAATATGKVRSRLLAIASVLDGDTRVAAAAKFGLGSSALSKWIRRYNSEGIDGVRDRPAGRPARKAH